MRINVSSVVDTVSIMITVMIIVVITAKILVSTDRLVVVIAAMVVDVIAMLGLLMAAAVCVVIRMVAFISMVRMMIVMMIFVVVMMMVWVLRVRNWIRYRIISRDKFSSTTSTLTIVYECVIMVAVIGNFCHGSTFFVNFQIFFPSILCFFRVQFKLFLGKIIDMVQNFPQHPYRVFLVFRDILHMRVPHKVCQLVWDNDLRGALEAHVEKLYIVHVAFFELKDLIRELLDEFVLPQTCLNHPFFCYLC